MESRGDCVSNDLGDGYSQTGVFEVVRRAEKVEGIPQVGDALFDALKIVVIDRGRLLIAL